MPYCFSLAFPHLSDGSRFAHSMNLNFFFALYLNFILLIFNSIAFFELECFFLLIFYLYLKLLKCYIALRIVRAHHYNIDHLFGDYFDFPLDFHLYYIDF